jgi:hypothetical protein
MYLSSLGIKGKRSQESEKKMHYLHGIWNSYGRGYEAYYLLKCDDV